MPFMGSSMLDARSRYNSGSTTSSLSRPSNFGNSRLPGSVFDRFGGRTATSANASTSSYSHPSKYRSSTLERPGATTSSPSTSSQDSFYSRGTNSTRVPFGPAHNNNNNSHSTLPKVGSPFGSSLHNGNIGHASGLNGESTTTLGKGRSGSGWNFSSANNHNLVNGNESRYKRATRSNSRGLFDSHPDSLNNPDDLDNKFSSYSMKVSQTLARHGAPQISVSDSKPSSGTDHGGEGKNYQWRRKLEESGTNSDNRNLLIEEPHVVMMVSRSTSPQQDPDRPNRTRIARCTESFPSERRSRPPRTVSKLIQTQESEEFGPLSLAHRKMIVNENFDYFDVVKKSLEKQQHHLRLQKAEDQKWLEELEDKSIPPEENFEEPFSKKASMTEILPGSQPLVKVKPQTTPVVSVEVEEESSEYEYETEEEEDEDDDGGEEESMSISVSTGNITNNNNESREEKSYEVMAEDILEDNSDLDYIDDEDDDEFPKNKKGKRKKKTFISGTIDIDVLLGKNSSDPSNLVSFDASPTQELPTTINKRDSLDLSNAISSKQLDKGEDKTWWSQSANNQDDNEDESQDLKTADVTITDENWPDDEEDYEEENEEEDWEWEYYEEGEEEEEQEKQEAGEQETQEEEESLEHKVPSLQDERAPWIIQGLNNLISNAPKPSRNIHDESEESEADEADNPVSFSEFQGKTKEKDYGEWLKESSKFEGKVEEILEMVQIPDPSVEKSDMDPEGNGTENKIKASRLVEKLQTLKGTDLKRILFSLKAVFQSDRSLVYDFVQADGIQSLIQLSNNHECGSEPQLQNLILRALGQIMLYVDGMNGVMANPKSIQFLYRLISSKNPLVCKTAIKLILVFVEYSDNNCLIFLQAINDVDKSIGNIPWTNVMEALKRDSSDIELLTFAMTLINKTLYGIPTQDTFYDHTDYMEELEIKETSDELMSKFPSEISLLQQLQLYNVALKQEDGEPVTEYDISYLDEDTTEDGLRGSLREKSGVVCNNFPERKSLRYKIRTVADADVDSTGDIQEVTFRDIEAILIKNGLPTSHSGDRLNSMQLDGFLEKARSVFVTKLSKGEHIQKEQEEQCQEEDVNNHVSQASPSAKEAKFQREGEIRWAQIVSEFDRPLIICDLDFSDLQMEDDGENEMETQGGQRSSLGCPAPPPPPPPIPPPPAPGLIPPTGGPPPIPAPPPLDENGKPQLVPKKHKKTVKLFWKEVRDSPMLALHGKTVWDDLSKAEVDPDMIEYLFEYRGKDTLMKETKQMLSLQREVIVLDTKRSNAINIGMTKLPPPRVIKSAVMKMDANIMNREGVEKLLTMIPTPEEVERIQEAQEAQPDIPLGTAEQFLLTLSSISCLEARLRLWSFKMEFESTEREVCEPLMDLKVGIESLEINSTFKKILSVLLTVGNYLNGSQCKGFQLDYLTKVPEVKDTIHKHSLLYHMTYWVLELEPSSSDLYSEIGPIIRASRTDFEDLERTLLRLESECKLAWDYLQVVSREDHTGGELETNTRNKMSDFLKDAAERIIVMNTVYQKVMQKYSKFLLWLGILPHLQGDYKAHHVCKILSEFALEYRTTRERVIQTIEKKKAAREKKRLQAKMSNFSNSNLAPGSATDLLQDSSSSRRRHHRKSREVNVEDSQLRAILGDDLEFGSNGTLRRKKKSHHHRHRDKGNHENSSSSAINGEETNSERKKDRRERKSRRHRSSAMDSALPITEEALRSFTGSEMELGLLETLMGTPDEGTLKRNKERRRSIKEKRLANKHGGGQDYQHVELQRSRTRDVWALLEEECR